MEKLFDQIYFEIWKALGSKGYKLKGEATSDGGYSDNGYFRIWSDDPKRFIDLYLTEITTNEAGVEILHYETSALGENPLPGAARINPVPHLVESLLKPVERFFHPDLIE